MNRKTNISLVLIALIFITANCTVYLPQSQLKFGVEAAQHGLWDEAIFRWKKAVEVEPNSAAAHNNLAVAYEAKGLFEKAEIEYRKALQLSPENENIQSNYQKFKKNINKNEKDGNKDENK